MDVGLNIRAGRGDKEHQMLRTLYAAVTEGTAAIIDGIAVPTDLTAANADCQEVRQWLWRVIIAHQPAHHEIDALLVHYRQLDFQTDLVVFHTRLVSSAIDAASRSGHPGVHIQASELVDRIVEVGDGTQHAMSSRTTATPASSQSSRHDALLNWWTHAHWEAAPYPQSCEATSRPRWTPAKR